MFPARHNGLAFAESAGKGLQGVQVKVWMLLRLTQFHILLGKQQYNAMYCYISVRAYGIGEQGTASHNNTAGFLQGAPHY